MSADKREVLDRLEELKQMVEELKTSEDQAPKSNPVTSGTIAYPPWPSAYR